MKVLVVDDDDDVRTITRLSLTTVGGLAVVEARNGPEALDLARREHPDLILLDVMMPEMDGPQTLQALRQHPSTADMPVVFLTAKALQSEIDRLRQFDVCGVLIKPFDPMTLAAQLRKMTAVRPGRIPSGASAPSPAFPS